MRASINSGFGLLVVSVLFAGICPAETVCFASPAEAAAQNGRTAAANGFWLEGVMRDRMRGGLWAQVGQCGHPEWPVRLVAASDAGPVVPLAGVARVRVRTEDPAKATTRGASQTSAVTAQPLQLAGETTVRAGATVVVVEQSEQVRLEVAGVATSNGWAGERIKVRVGNQQLVVGTVRAGGWVEIE